MQRALSNDALEECAPTERDPHRSTLELPARGVALSVLWWLESDADGAPGDSGKSAS